MLRKYLRKISVISANNRITHMTVTLNILNTDFIFYQQNLQCISAALNDVWIAVIKKNT